MQKAVANLTSKPLRANQLHQVPRIQLICLANLPLPSPSLVRNRPVIFPLQTFWARPSFWLGTTFHGTSRASRHPFPQPSLFSPVESWDARSILQSSLHPPCPHLSRIPSRTEGLARQLLPTSRRQRRHSPWRQHEVHLATALEALPSSAARRNQSQSRT